MNNVCITINLLSKRVHRKIVNISHRIFQIVSLENNMKTPADYRKPCGVFNVGIVFITCLYGFVGLIGYMKYGDDTKGSVTLNLPQDAM